MGPVLKRAAERLLRYGGAAQIGYLRQAGRSLVLAYHNILPAGQAAGRDRSLHLPQSDFASQLDLLQQRAEVVPLANLLFAPAPGGKRPLVAITFDDAYRGALTAGLAELRARSLPATVFVAPAFVGQGGFWWDEMVPPGTGGLTDAFRQHALEEWQGKDAVIREQLARDGGRVEEAAPACRCIDEAGLRMALEFPGLSLGAHTWSHPNLNVLPDAELLPELARPREWLSRFGKRVLPVLTYPYGLADARVEREAEAAGYRAALRVDGGWLPASAGSRFALPRLNIPAGLTVDGFALRLGGLFC
jgi:peptidoglycan/xylan/chitin deacetylase (PgdA/CDA1 family)